MTKAINFSLSLLFFWVKGSINVDSRFVKYEGANTILGFIPAGKDTQTIPLKNISATRISSSYKIFPMLVGIILIFSALGAIGDSFIQGLILLLLGVGIFGNGIITILIIQRAGNDFYISVPFFDKGKLLKAQDLIEEGLSLDTDKTDLNQFFEKKEQ